jgi:hypothetical protein
MDSYLTHQKELKKRSRYLKLILPSISKSLNSGGSGCVVVGENSRESSKKERSQLNLAQIVLPYVDLKDQ